MKVKGNASASKDTLEAEAKERVLAKPNNETIIRALNGLNYTLVVENFHYLTSSVQKELFQSWKRFMDEGISVVVIETTHRAIDIANANKDLVGRITHIDMEQWDDNDLKKIIEQGFKYLGKDIDFERKAKIATESCGLPIITQQICLEIFTRHGLEYVSEAKKSKIVSSAIDIPLCIHSVARDRYKFFEQNYKTLIEGPREKTRKYKTYEILLTCFTIDPVKFCLSRSEIDDRIRKIEIQDDERPPAASINSSLGAITIFQQKRKLELLDWRPQEAKLYILEPTFLFFVRWRRPRNDSTIQLDFFERLITRDLFKTLVDMELKMIRMPINVNMITQKGADKPDSGD